MGILFDRLVAYPNLVRAYDHVEDNHGCAGVDGQKVEDFGEALESGLTKLRDDIVSGAYKPSPLLRVSVEKANGQKRPLSIPTVRDRIAQTAAALVLTPILDPEFEEVSFAYRKGRSVDQAIQRIIALRDKGYTWVADADIRSYFDEIPHDKLLEVLALYVEDHRVLDLVAKWLKVTVCDDGKQFLLTKGVPQGSPLSPLLANLYLDRFDEAHLHQGNKLVRFADDFVVLCKSRPEAAAALELSEEGEEEPIEPTSGYDPSMRTLYLMEHGTEIGKEDERFIIRKEGKIIREVPALKVDQVMIFGNIRITTPMMQFCLIEDIPIFLLSSRGRYYGVIESAKADKITLHRDQFIRTSDPAFVLAVSREIVRGKISNTRTILLRYGRRGKGEKATEAAENILSIMRQLDKVASGDCFAGTAFDIGDKKYSAGV